MLLGMVHAGQPAGQPTFIVGLRVLHPTRVRHGTAAQCLLQAGLSL